MENVNSAKSNPCVDRTELIFLGTGTSSSVPHIGCLTTPPGGKRCQTCLSTLTLEGKKNIRRNTSVALRIRPRDDGETITIVVDVGKNFQAAALEWFPKYGLRRIDAVLITHPHADAINGLDDLRAWTLGSSIQSHIDVYLSQAAFTTVQRSFPYLVLKEFASGGGDVPDFRWHIIVQDVPFYIGNTGVRVTPLVFHHGLIFTAKPLPELILDTTSSPTPTECGKEAQLSPTNPSAYICFGFRIQDVLVYASDVSSIPEDTWALLESMPVKVFVLDCLRLASHTSHMGLIDSIAAARRLQAYRTYLTGFNHDISHDEYVTIGKAVGGEIDSETAELSSTERARISAVGEGSPIWVRPAHDGLRVVLRADGTVTDESYDDVVW